MATWRPPRTLRTGLNGLNAQKSNQTLKDIDLFATPRRRRYFNGRYFEDPPRPGPPRQRRLHDFGLKRSSGYVGKKVYLLPQRFFAKILLQAVKLPQRRKVHFLVQSAHRGDLQVFWEGYWGGGKEKWNEPGDKAVYSQQWGQNCTEFLGIDWSSSLLPITAILWGFAQAQERDWRRRLLSD